MVIAGDEKPPDNNVLKVIAMIENQKLPWFKQQAAVKGKAMKLLNMQTIDFALLFYFSK